MSVPGSTPQPTGPAGVEKPVVPAGRGARSRGSRTGTVWVTLVAAALAVLLLLIFILQNGQRVRLSFLWFDGDLPMGVALLLAAVTGALLMALAGTLRILQLRRTRRSRVAPAPTGPAVQDPPGRG